MLYIKRDLENTTPKCSKWTLDSDVTNTLQKMILETIKEMRIWKYGLFKRLKILSFLKNYYVKCSNSKRFNVEIGDAYIKICRR